MLIDGLARSAARSTHDTGAALAQSRRHGGLYRRPRGKVEAAREGRADTTPELSPGSYPAALGPARAGSGVWWRGEIRNTRRAGRRAAGGR